MADQILAFYLYTTVASFLFSFLAYNYCLPKVGLKTNPNEPNSNGIKPFANHLLILDDYIQSNDLIEKIKLNLKRLKIWLTINLLLAAGIPIVVVLQIAISNSLR